MIWGQLATFGGMPSPEGSALGPAATRTARESARRHLVFAGWLLVSGSILWAPLAQLVRFSFRYEHSSHIVLIPLVSVYLIYVERRKIFSIAPLSLGTLGLACLAGLAALYVYDKYSTFLNANDVLSLTVPFIIGCWVAGFMACYGKSALRRAAFPLAFLLLMTPIPTAVLNATISVLQSASAGISSALFKMLGVPVFRENIRLLLPGLTVEVAKECSGIRSSLALIITGLLMTHFYLQSAWSKALLCLTIPPLAVLKNGIRIVTICWLAIYVDRRILTGSLHRRGGVIFFLIALLMLGFELHLLQKLEGKLRSRPVKSVCDGLVFRGSAPEAQCTPSQSLSARLPGGAKPITPGGGKTCNSPAQ